MKKKILLIILTGLILPLLSACHIFNDYILDGYDKLLTKDSYTQTNDITDININIDKYIYKWENLSEGEYISPNGTYIKKSDNEIYLRTPSLKELYIDTSLKIVSFEEKRISIEDNFTDSDIVKIYKYEQGKVIIVENKYLYALDNDCKNIYVNEDYTRTFRLQEDILVVDCSDILSGLTKVKRSYINTNDSGINAYYRYDKDAYSIYFISKTPSSFVDDLSERGYLTYEVDRSYIGDVDNHKVWYLVSSDENFTLKVTYEVLGKENVVTTKIDVYNIKGRKLINGFITKDNEWNEEVTSKLAELNISIPFYKMGKFYLINNTLSDNNFDESFCKLSDECYKIYDYYYLPNLEGYVSILEENGFLKYETPVNIKKAENEEYNDWRAAYNYWLSTGEDKYFDTYISKDRGIFVKLTYDINYGNIIEIYKV